MIDEVVSLRSSEAPQSWTEVLDEVFHESPCHRFQSPEWWRSILHGAGSSSPSQFVIFLFVRPLFENLVGSKAWRASWSGSTGPTSIAEPWRGPPVCWKSHRPSPDLPLKIWWSSMEDLVATDSISNPPSLPGYYENSSDDSDDDSVVWSTDF